MKKGTVLLLVCCLFLLWGSTVSSAPLDLSTFTADPGVTESGGVISFAEDMNYSALYFFDNAFAVPVYAKTLSFDYDFNLGDFDEFDYLTFEFNYVPQLIVDLNITGGHFSFDMTPYQGQTIDLAWGLLWGGDFEAGTTASVYNIDLTPVPEPGTMMLLASGLVGLIGITRRKFLDRA